MNATETQITELYENSNLTSEQISCELELCEESVKMVLQKYSPKFRMEESSKSLQETKDKEFTTDEFTAAKQAIASLLYAEHEGTRLRAAKFIVNENKGRNDVKQAINTLYKNSSFNVLIINEQLSRARQALENSKKLAEVSEKIIDVAS